MPLVDRHDSVLVVVDAQPGFFDHGAMTDADRAQALAAVERIAWLAGFAGLLDVPVVLVEEDADTNGATDARIAERVAAGTPVAAKDTFGLTACDAAMDAVRATGRGTVALAGFETDVCVAQSAVGLLDLGYRVAVCEDATFSSGEQQRFGMRRMTHAGAEPTSVKGLVFEWLRTIADARAIYPQAVERFGRLPG